MAQQISSAADPAAIAAAYEDGFVPLIGAPLAEALVDDAGVAPGERVLDVACGTGIVARLAAARAGAAGRVAGVDVAEAMLDVARRASPAGIAWHLAGADDMPLPDGTADVVLCQLGLQFMDDRPAALREMRRTLRPGGRIAVTVPGPIPAPFAAMEEALAAHAGPRAAAFVGAVFALHEPDEVAALLDDAGFADAGATARTMRLRLPPPRAFLWGYVASTPLAMATAGMDDAARDALEGEVVERWRPHTDAGELLVDVRVTTGTGRA